MKNAGIYMALLVLAVLLLAGHPGIAMATPDYGEGLNQARRQATAGDYPAAERTLLQLDASYPDNPEIEASLGRVRLWQKDYPGAARFFRQSLEVKNDPSVRQELIRAEAAHLETLIQNGEGEEALTLFASLTPLERAGLSNARPDLPFRILRNNLKIEGGLFVYSGNRPNELDLSIALTQHIGHLTGVLTGSRVRRFGLTGTQAGLELHSPLGAGSNRSGFLSGTVSPDASFLPRYTVGGEYYQGWSGVEGSIGFSRLGFSESAINILIPGVTIYPATTLSLNERLYVVLDSGAFTALTTIKWEPDHRFRGAYAIGIGSAAEHITSSVDTTRYFTISNRISGES